MTNLIISLAQVDPSKARELEERLPELENDSKIDPEELENLPVVITRYIFVQQHAKIRITKREKPQPEASQASEAVVRSTKPKTKKKKKNKPPKEIAPGSVPDPDRWKPKVSPSCFAYSPHSTRGPPTREREGLAGAAPEERKGLYPLLP
jgi:hypothetical protein